jgi:hypothetical protein
VYLKKSQALEHIVYYVILAPHNNEQSDMLHHLYVDPALAKLELHQYALHSPAKNITDLFIETL